VLKALALGARAVLIGRPIFWGLAIDGELGVRNVLEIFRSELDSNMTLCGVADVENVSRRLVATPADWGRDETQAPVALLER
jgi:isopentenyl diphosphate isomerase/L-lactate dehydrogenase-like FMN-dependent dehydrogenase